MNRIPLNPLAMASVMAASCALPLAAQDDVRRAGQSQNVSATIGQESDDLRGEVEVSDAALARWLIDDHRMEIELSRWAEQTLEEQQAVSYAKRMIEDHQQMVTRLERYTGQGDTGTARDEEPGGITIDTPEVEIEVDVDREDVRDAAGRAADAVRRTLNRDGARLDRRTDRIGERRVRREDSEADAAPPSETRGERRRERRRNLRGDRSGPATSDLGANWLRIKDQLTDQKVRSARKTLERYTGNEQIETFVAMQLIHHRAMLDTLAVFQQHASPELSGLLEENAAKVQAHLQMAGKLMGHASRR